MKFVPYTLALLMSLWALQPMQAQEPVQRSQNLVSIGGAKYYVHSVSRGETLAAIARCYGVSEQLLLAQNPSVADGLKVGQTLKIPQNETSITTIKAEQNGSATPQRSEKEERRLLKTFVKHKVRPGETLYAIGRQYEISIETLLNDNPTIDPHHLVVDSELLIRKKAIGRTDEKEAQAEWEAYAPNMVTPGKESQEPSGSQEAETTSVDPYIYYVVQPKETIYSLSRRFGMSEADFIALNNLADGLKTGATIRVPNPDAQARNDRTSEQTLTEVEIQPAREVIFSALRPSQTLRVAMLLPLTGSESGRNFAAFYQGFLLGLEEVKERGYSVDLTLFDTQKSLSAVEEIVLSERFQTADLIVGPIYPEGIDPVLRHAEEHAVPVVSPLADFSSINSDALFQMAPTDAHKYDKLKSLLDSGASITLIRTPQVDKEFEREVMAQLEEYPYEIFHYETVQGVENAERGDLTPLLTKYERHLFFVLSESEVEVDRILASLSSAQTNLVARSLGNPEYKVVGSARWNRYTNIDRTAFFRNQVILFTLFHAKRDNESVQQFDTRYIRAFGSMPSLYSYRGYETALIFCPGMYSDIEYDMEGRRYRPLQTTYTFRSEGDKSTHINQEWVRIQYNSDFTITLE